jgi:hypothetical protein
MADNALERRFSKEMGLIYERAVSECDYRPNYFLQMIKDRGALSTARALLSGQPSQGFVKLWELGRLDLSVEALVVREDWQSMFRGEELAIARKRLLDAGFQVE